MNPDRIDYDGLWRATAGLEADEALRYFAHHLPFLCGDAYRARSHRPAVIVRIQHGTFEYVFDHYTSLEAIGAVPYSPTDENRLVVAHGRSAPWGGLRDDYRLRGGAGPTGGAFGGGWDKGHYIAHSLGGAVNGLEANVFVQRRELSRGWSAAGQRFRAMEGYCLEHPGTLCFARPIYLDGTARPGWLEYGIVYADSGPEVACFDNRSPADAVAGEAEPTVGAVPIASR